MGLRALAPDAVRLGARATVAAARGVGSLALQGGSAYAQGTYDLYRRIGEEAEEMRRNPPPPRESLPDYPAANALRPRLQELTFQVVAELQPSSTYISRFQTALNRADHAITRGQAAVAEVMLDEIERTLEEVAEEHRRHQERTRGLPRRP
jgi:hypothetical protein